MLHETANKKKFQKNRIVDRLASMMNFFDIMRSRLFVLVLALSIGPICSISGNEQDSVKMNENCQENGNNSNEDKDKDEDSSDDKDKDSDDKDKDSDDKDNGNGDKDNDNGDKDKDSDDKDNGNGKEDSGSDKEDNNGKEKEENNNGHCKKELNKAEDQKKEGSNKEKKENGKDKKNKKGKGKNKKDKDEHEEKSVKAGNLALKASQQPGPLISFGENIFDKGTKQVYLLVDDYLGQHKHFIDIFPSYLYCPTDELSIYFNVPYAVSYRDKERRSAGLEDAFVQLEYAYYTKETKCYQDQFTIVGFLGFPTGSALKVPPTGFGTLTGFLGLTFNRTAVDWLYFSSFGAVVSGSIDGTKIANQYLYEFGIGKNIWYSKHSIFAWILEFDGVYANRNRIEGIIDPKSGGNTVYMTPSLWYSTDHLILQFGIGYAIVSQLYGDQLLGPQGRNLWVFIGNFGWTF